MRTPVPSLVQATGWMTSMEETYPPRRPNGWIPLLCGLAPRRAPTIGKMPVEEADQHALLGRMRAPAVPRVPAPTRQRDRLALVEVPRHDHRMHVRRAADRRRVAQLRGDEAHRERDVSLRFAGTFRWPELGEHGRRAQRAAPGAKVLRAVAADAPTEIVVHLARGERVPGAVALVTEEAPARRAQLAPHESYELGIVDDLALRNAPLARVLEIHGAVSDRHVGLLERGDAEGAILAQVALAADAAERLADQAKHGGRDRVAVERRGGGARPRILVQRAPKPRQLSRQLPHAIVLA